MAAGQIKKLLGGLFSFLGEILPIIILWLVFSVYDRTFAIILAIAWIVYKVVKAIKILDREGHIDNLAIALKSRRKK